MTTSLSWKEEQVRFWYGDLYESMKSRQWDAIKDHMKKTIFGTRVQGLPGPTSTSVDGIKEVYGTYGQYRFEGMAEVVRDIVSRKPSDDVDYAYPVLMVDTINDATGCITYNRLSQRKTCMLWPLPYHERENLHGFDDELSWDEKAPKVVFRGSPSSPYTSYTLSYSGNMKPSRLTIVSRYFEEPWGNLGIVRPEVAQKKQTEEEMATMRRYVKPLVSRRDQLKHKFILCIEGADISSSFGWVLASNSVPLHNYPFNHEVWYFCGLQPWVHFIPFKNDGSDLGERVAWCLENDDACRAIAQAGREHMKRICEGTEEVKTMVAALWNMPQGLFKEGGKK